MKRLLLTFFVLTNFVLTAEAQVYSTIRVDSLKDRLAVSTNLIHVFNPLRMRYDASNYADFTVSSGGTLTVAPTGGFTLSPSGSVTLNNLTADRLVATNSSKALVNSISSANLFNSLTNPTGTAGSAMFSISPAMTGTPTTENFTFTGTLLASGPAANYAIGSNFISNGGTDAGFSLDASNNAILSGNLTLNGTAIGIPTTGSQTTFTMGEHHIRRTDASTLDINPADDVRFFRLTNDADATLSIMKGDGTATTMASIAANTGNITTAGNLTVNGVAVLIENATDATLRLTETGNSGFRFLYDGDGTNDLIIGSGTAGTFTPNATWTRDNGNLLFNRGNVTITADLAVNGGYINTSALSGSIFNTTMQTLDFGGAVTALTVGATTGLLTLRNPSVVLNAEPNTFSSSLYASQTTGFRVGDGGKADFRYLYVDEMHAKAFIADLEQALAGSQIITKSVAKIDSADFVVPTAGNTAKLVVEEFFGFTGQVFEDGDIIRLRQFTRTAGNGLTIADAWGTVTFLYRNGDNNPPTQAFNFTRSTGTDSGTFSQASNPIEVGALALDYGQTNGGYLESNAVDGAGAPWHQTATWTTHPAQGLTVRSRLGNLAGITDADFGGTLSGFGLYTENTFLKGNLAIKSDVPLALINSTIMAGNITGTANSAIKITNTGTASTSGFFAYNASGTQLFKLALDATAQISAGYFSATDIWAGNSSLASATLVMGDLDGTPKFALGASADAITVAGAEVGTIFDASGNFKTYGSAGNFIRRSGGVLDIESTNFELASGNLGLSGNTTSSYMKIGTLADATTTATTNSGFRADNNGNVLIKGNTSGSDYVKITGGGGIDINASVFSLATSTLVLESTVPKLALGPTASSISMTAGTGFFADGSQGDFKAGTGNLGVSPTGTGVSYDASVNTFQAVSGGTVMFSVNATTARLVSMYAASDDIWAGNASLSNVNTTFALEALNTTTPTLSLGAQAASMSMTGGTGIYMDGAGNFRAATGAPITAGVRWTAASSLFEVYANSVAVITANASGATIAGFTATASQFSSTGIKLVSGAAKTSRLEVDGGSSNVAGIVSPATSTDIVQWAGDSYANRESAPWRLYADGFFVSSNSPYDLANTAELYDDFFNSTPSLTTEFGELGWATTGLSAISGQSGTTGRPGQIRISSTSGSEDAYIYVRSIEATDPATYWFSAKTVSVTNNWGGAVGLFDISTGTFLSGIYFYRSNGDLGGTNWFARTTSGGTSTTTDTGVAASTSFKQFKIVVESGSSVKFYIDGTLEATHTTNIPTGSIGVGFLVKSENASSTESMNIDYFQMRMNGLSR